MSTRYNDASHYENHQRAAELHDLAAHAHRAAEQHGKQEYLTGHEHSRQAMEHSRAAHEQTQLSVNRHGLATFGHREIETLAYDLWQARGCPHGSPEEDWHRAIEQLLARAHDH
jgi:hypothetical protein